MKLLISTLALSFALVGCSNDNYVSSPPPKPVYEKVEILEVDPPKHFRIIVYDKESKVQSSVSISKHCRVKDNLIGSETTVTRNTYININSLFQHYACRTYRSNEV